MTDSLPRWDEYNIDSLRRFAEIRMVVLDIDGTATSASHTTINANLDTLRRQLVHSKRQVSLTIATGRTLAGALPIIRQLGIPAGTPLILYNGSVVVVSGRFSTVHRRTISPSSLIGVIAACRAQSVRVYAYVFADLGYEFFEGSLYSEVVYGWCAEGGPAREANGMEVQWSNSASLAAELSPSAIVIDTANSPNLPQDTLDELSAIPGTSLTKSGSRYIEIRPAGSSKGSALGYVATRLNMDSRSFLALGDNDNDVEMLRWAGIGIAIKDASQAAIDSSDYVCHHGTAEGAIEVLRLVRDTRKFFFNPNRSPGT